MIASFDHHAINADDVEGALAFYGRVFGWSFEEYMPGFHRFVAGDGRIVAVQQRRDVVPGARANGPECTATVEDVERTAREVEAAGGTILMAPTAIPGAGTVCFFSDPDGNVLGAFQPAVAG